LEKLPLLRSILAAHNSRVADAIYPDQLDPPSYIADSHYVFVAIDTEFNGKVLLEVGYAAIDTADLVDKMPGPKGKGWFNLIEASHFAVRNKDVVRYRKPFNFGSGEAITVDDVSRHTRRMIDRWHKAGRRVVIVGQSLSVDLDRLQFNIGFNITKFPGVFGLLDTNDLTAHSNANGTLRKLYKGLNGTGGTKFHNAGNDAVYCLRVMLMLAMTPRSEWPRRTIEKVILPEKRGVVKSGDRSASDIETTSGISGWLRSLHETMQDILTATRKEIKTSDKIKSLTKEPKTEVMLRETGTTDDWLRKLHETMEDISNKTWRDIRTSKKFTSLTKEQQIELRLTRMRRHGMNVNPTTGRSDWLHGLREIVQDIDNVTWKEIRKSMSLTKKEKQEVKLIRMRRQELYWKHNEKQPVSGKTLERPPGRDVTFLQHLKTTKWIRKIRRWYRSLWFQYLREWYRKYLRKWYREYLRKLY